MSGRAAAEKIARERVEAQFALLLFLAVAAQAVGRQKWQHFAIETGGNRFLIGRRRRFSGAGVHRGAQQQTHNYQSRDLQDRRLYS